jgi:hypothetical protein
MSFIEKLAAGVSGFSRGIQAGQQLGYQIGGGPQAEQQRERRTQRRREIQQLYGTSPVEAIKAAEQEGFAGLASAYRSDQQRQAGVMRAGITTPQALGTGGVGDFSPESLEARRESLVAAQTGLGELSAAYGPTMPQAEREQLTQQERELQERINIVNNYTQAISNLQQVTDFPSYEVQALALEESLKDIDPEVAAGVMRNFRRQFDDKARLEINDLMSSGAIIPADTYIPSKYLPVVTAYTTEQDRGLARNQLGALANLNQAASLFNDPAKMETFVRERGDGLGLSRETVDSIVNVNTRSIAARKNKDLYDIISDLNRIIESERREFFTSFTRPEGFSRIAQSFGVPLELTGGDKEYQEPTAESVIRLANAILDKEAGFTQTTAITDSVTPVSSASDLEVLLSTLNKARQDKAPQYEEFKSSVQARLEELEAQGNLTEEEKKTIRTIMTTHGLNVETVPGIFPATAAGNAAQSAVLGGNMVGGFGNLFGGLFSNSKQNLPKPRQMSLSPPPDEDKRVATGRPN